MSKTNQGYECVIQALRTANALWRESRRFFAPYGLTEAQFNVLNILSSEAQGISQQALSRALVVDRSNVTLLLDRMSVKKWVERLDSPGDRRAYRVRLTPSGRALWSKVYPFYREEIEMVVAGIKTPELEAASKLLKKLEARIQSRTGKA